MSWISNLNRFSVWHTKRCRSRCGLELAQQALEARNALFSRLFLSLALRLRGSRARWTKSQVVLLESSHAEHGLRLSHRIFRLLHRSQMRRRTCSINKKCGAVFKRIKCERCEVRAQLEMKGMSPGVVVPAGV